MKALSSDEIRRRFVRFFVEHGHTPYPSSSLIPTNDPTLLFTNAGMNQFKSVFLGEEAPKHQRAVSIQKCVRAGGKHNDLENVGYTARHHTFFEMLGNFSFGDYFKKQAISLAWKFITSELEIPVHKLFVTVFQDDKESLEIWKNDIQIDVQKISRLGEKDNFWSMGETGPCGPCSEIFYDQGVGTGCGKATCKVGCDCDRFMEIWNLVFMEFDQQSTGMRVKLPKPSIDTGMGLERITAVMQGKSTNYDTDLFLPSLKQISFICEKDYASAKEVDKKSMRVIADHIRAMTFLIADGILPSKEGRGYVLRRIMRRAIRYGKRLGINKPFLSELSTVVINQFSDHYPELVEKRQRIKDAIGEEEIQFEKTIHQGLQILNDEIIKLKSSGARMFPGELGFRLYDTYGFPVDLTNDVLREQGFTLDQAAYDEAFVSHREKARGSWKGSQSNDLIHLISAWRKAKVTTEFVGYETLSTEARIIKIAVGGKEVNVAVENDECEIVCDRTPFYGESGGQMGDIGVMTSKHCSIEVIDTKKYDSNLHVHFCKIVEGQLNLGDNVNLSVDQKARQATAKNHTATHILHATLIDILGDHIEQKGSLVAPERLRFDFSHSRSLTDTEIFKIEQTINERIWQNDTVSSATMPLDEAVTAGAKALFNEKYGDEVRVISVGRYSKELCGGTHLLRAGEIGFFKIVKESSVAAGIRRIEAFTGSRALRYIADLDLGFKKLSQTLGVSIDKVPERVSALLTRQKDSKKNGDLNKSSDIQATTETINKIEFAYGVIDDPELRDVRNFADRLLEKHPKAIVVVANKSTGVMAIKVSSEIKIFKANECVDFLKSELGVSGGGKPNMAQVAGLGKNHITQAIDHIKKQIKNIKV